MNDQKFTKQLLFNQNQYFMYSMKNLLKFSFLFFLVLGFTQCTEDAEDDSITLSGKAQFELTDAPIDDANVKGAFVTVTAVKVDGEVISDFSGKQTIDLLAYQNGNTQALGLADLEAGTYSNISLVLDYETDANGDQPGCYVLTTDNTKKSLQANGSSTGEIKVNSGSFSVQENSTSNVVIDFDVRKAITRDGDEDYDFATESELEAALRVVTKSNTGTLNGNCSDNLNTSDRIVVYAYKKGSFNKDTELSGQGSSNIEFKNAVTSAVVDGNGDYTLAFLEKGEYELHFVSYTDDDNDGKMELQGELELSILGNLGLDLFGLTVESNTSLTVNVNVIGLIP